MATEPTTVTLFHPTIPDVTQTVETAQVKDWTDAGWTKTETKAVKTAKSDD